MTPRPDAGAHRAEELLRALEPTAEGLLNRHLGMAREWFPHELIPYSLGRDYEAEPWTPDQPRLTGVARVAFEVNLLTEDNLPSYHRLIHTFFGNGDGAWINWANRWTAEEGRHAIVLRDYLTVTRNCDPISLSGPACTRCRLATTIRQGIRFGNLPMWRSRNLRPESRTQIRADSHRTPWRTASRSA